jgi:hypothetical protein
MDVFRQVQEFISSVSFGAKVKKFLFRLKLDLHTNKIISHSEGMGRISYWLMLMTLI